MQKLKLNLDQQLKVNEEEVYEKVSSDSERAASKRDKKKKIVIRVWHLYSSVMDFNNVIYCKM